MPSPSTGNAERFLAAFREIEDLLSTEADRRGGGHRRSFGELVDGSRRPAAAHFRRDLRELQELRNAIVHMSSGDGRPIAEPHDATVALIEGIARRLAEPPPAMDAAHRDVLVCDAGDDLAGVLSRMRERGVATVPVLDGGGVAGLLTGDTVARWLAGALAGGQVRSRPVREVLDHEEHPGPVVVLAATVNAYAALARFTEGLADGRPPRAVVLTATGAPDGRVVGVLTAADVPRLAELAGAV